jgi:hypothetical protein
MKFLKQIIFIPMLSLAVSAQATATTDPPLLEAELNNQTIYSGAAISTGAGSIVGGNLQSVAATTLGAQTVVGANVEAGAAITLGASAKVGEDVTAYEAITLGAYSRVGGNLKSRAAAELGAHAVVSGDVISEASVTLGDTASSGGSSGKVVAGIGAVVLGAHSTVFNVRAGTSITKSASAFINGNGYDTTPSVVNVSAVENRKEQLDKAQLALRSMTTTHPYATTITVDTRLVPGVYHAPGLTTTAGITLTLVGSDPADPAAPSAPAAWVFNIDSYLSFGANLTMKLENVHPDSTIIWNTGGYTFVGAGSNLIGAILAGTYVTTGAGTKLAGIDGACGGILTITGAVTLGANNTMGGENCTPGAINNVIIDSGGTAGFVDPEAGPTAPAGPPGSLAP